MNPSKKLLIGVYLVFLVVFFWGQEKKQQAPKPEPVRIVANAKKYTLPATPIISVINETDKEVVIDTCRDIQMVSGMVFAPIPANFCRSVTVAPKTTAPLIGEKREDIVHFQENFRHITTAQNLGFRYKHLNNEIGSSEVQVMIRQAGVFRLFFRHVFYDPVYNLFVALALIFPGYSLGWAIIAITLIIRLGLLIPQQKMLVSQRRMQVIQPKIKAIQETHKGDQATIGMKMMELYKKEGVNPLGSCLPILIQIPILIVLYQVILNISNPTNFTHLYSFGWLQNFQNITLNTEFFGLHLEKSGGFIGIILGILTGVLQFGQMWLAQQNTKDKPAKDGSRVQKTKGEENDKQLIINDKPIEGMPDMQQMQKMMIYIFPAMAALFAYQFPAGVGLYWLIGTVFMIVQQFFANKQAEDKKMVIRDKAGNVVG